MYAFRTAKEMLDANLPRQPIERFGHPRKAYVYFILCKKGRSKIGQTTNPNVRVRELCGCKCYKELIGVAIVGPTKQWRGLEERLLVALQPFMTAKAPINILYDDFLLPDEISVAVNECFARDCFPDAVERLERIIKSPSDYQI